MEAVEAIETYGIISLIPVLVVIISAVISKRALESLVLGTFVGSIILTKSAWWGTWFDYTLKEIGDSAYYIIMFGMFGAMIRILQYSGSALGFSDIGAKVANSRKKTMIFTWILGIIIFVEDYLNALGVGVAMQTLTDKWKISREYLAFIVNSTGAAVCILVPFSSWGILYASQIEEVGILEGMSGFTAYVSSIPFMLYAWIAVIVVPLFCLGVIPLYGPMKKAEERVALTGRVFPDYHYEGDEVEGLEDETKASSAWNFIVPMIVLIAVAIYTADIVFAVIISVVVAFIMLFVQKLMTLGQFCDHIVGGFKDMLYVTMLVLAAFVLQDFNDALGLTPYVIESVAPILSPALFPAITFLVIAGLAFATGSFWGVAAISFPIILPLAVALNVNPFLAIGAVSAATAFGSHACFYSDAVTVTCAATGLKNMDYARTAIPLIGLPFILGIIAYLAVGIVMA
ncbi:Na+/H+ antiporter NhaC family protein [Sinanaerobacter chloroacetimidivorans]|jgi:Na+/H+ antiporter NhaC|uniref:Sodium:proton antiporter n=1 Tax=Sinanaerobacter chloroacetimidivorans TaxID=2818044 RepID=A0A8J7W5S7_9FIRM|nr:Na+/H+ antiporter NhaC family protein [Sinanaerobacter chloroacetimidivorans]MBR0599450.1 sodium:proton antiporter [Sinanaerobacter chloroacetimidivorans]